MPQGKDIVGVTATANHMDMFEDGYFDLVLSNATLEHDKNFWLTAAEMRRVLHPGGTMIVGVPGYVRDDTKSGEDAILILNHHGPGDYYRLSDEAMHEVVFEGFEDVTITVVPTPPRIIGLGRKPAAADADPQCT